MESFFIRNNALNNPDPGSVLFIYNPEKKRSYKTDVRSAKSAAISRWLLAYGPAELHGDSCEKSHCPAVQLWTEEHFVSRPSRGHHAMVVLTPLLFSSHKTIASQPMLMLWSRYHISSGRQEVKEKQKNVWLVNVKLYCWIYSRRHGIMTILWNLVHTTATLIVVHITLQLVI